MKTPLLLFAFALALTGCKQKEIDSQPLETAAPEVAAHLKGTACYAYTSGNDTISMTLSVNAGNAAGELTYKLDGKDANTGTFSGTFIGDTLFADYTFQSEGVKSVREIAFLKKRNKLIEGFAPVEEADGHVVFADARQLKFDSKLVLSRKDCFR